MRRFAALLVLGLWSATALGQTVPETVAVADTTGAPVGVPRVAVQADGDVTLDPARPNRSPRGALLRSAVLPGWGQAYNGKAWKVPIVAGVLGGLAVGFVRDHRAYTDLRHQVADSLGAYEQLAAAARARGETPPGFLPSPALNQLIFRRDALRNDRETWVWWGLLAYGLQLADAFVDAHLLNFDASPPGGPELTIGLLPTADPTPRLTLSVRW